MGNSDKIRFDGKPWLGLTAELERNVGWRERLQGKGVAAVAVGTSMSICAMVRECATELTEMVGVGAVLGIALTAMFLLRKQTKDDDS